MAFTGAFTSRSGSMMRVGSVSSVHQSRSWVAVGSKAPTRCAPVRVAVAESPALPAPGLKLHRRQSLDVHQLVHLVQEARMEVESHSQAISVHDAQERLLKNQLQYEARLQADLKQLLSQYQKLLAELKLNLASEHLTLAAGNVYVCGKPQEEKAAVSRFMAMGAQRFAHYMAKLSALESNINDLRATITSRRAFNYTAMPSRQ